MSRFFGDGEAMRQAGASSSSDLDCGAANLMHQEAYWPAGNSDVRSKSGQLVSNDHLACPDPFASHQQKEPYPGYYDQVAHDRKEINNLATQVFTIAEDIAGAGIGLYAIFGDCLKAKRKSASSANWLLAKLLTPQEKKQLEWLDNQKKLLTAAPHSVQATATLERQTQAIDKAVLFRSRMHAIGGLGLGIGASYIADQIFFKDDTLGDGSALANMLVNPGLSLIVPGNFVMKTAAIVGAHFVLKAFDDMTQPHYIYDPRVERTLNIPMSQVNHFRAIWTQDPEPDQIKIQNTYTHASADNQMIITAPGATPLPRTLFTPEDICNQQANRTRQEKEIQNAGQ